MESETKICGRCGLEKPIDEFGFRYVKLGIRHSWCKDCFVDYKRLWYERNGDRHRAHVKERRAAAQDENQRRVWEYLALFFYDAGAAGIYALSLLDARRA